MTFLRHYGRPSDNGPEQIIVTLCRKKLSGAARQVKTLNDGNKKRAQVHIHGKHTGVVQGATEVKRRIIYECRAYKRGGAPFSSEYKKSFFAITAAHRLHYNDLPAARSLSAPERSEDAENYREKGWLSCLGMLVKEREVMETIEGKECYTFTIQAKEGTRTSEIECACETNDQREKLLATILEIQNIQMLVAEKRSAAKKAPADPKVVVNLDDSGVEINIVDDEQYCKYECPYPNCESKVANAEEASEGGLCSLIRKETKKSMRSAAPPMSSKIAAEAPSMAPIKTAPEATKIAGP
jgi:hypothetical protein